MSSTAPAQDGLPPGESESEAAPAPDGSEPDGVVLGLPMVDNRERALPIRPGDLSRLLIADLNASDAALMATLCHSLAAIYHIEFFERLKELKELYAPLDPDSDYVRLKDHSRERTLSLDEQFLDVFEAAMDRANYRPLNVAVVQSAVEAPNELGLNYVPDFTLFEHIRVYARGYTKITRTVKSIQTGFKKKTITLDAYQRLLIALKFREGLEFGQYVRSDVLYLRLFKDVPHVDMEMHLPEQGTRVRMRWIDRAQIASPLLVGIPTVAFKLIFATLISPAALGGLMIAPLSAGVKSFFGFLNAKQKHLSHMIRSLYYHTLANNASVLTRLIDSAEEEEYKEAILSYYFLWRAGEADKPWTEHSLDKTIAAFLKEKTGIEINFEISDALAKLYRLGLARRDHDGRLRAVPPREAVETIRLIWKGSLAADA